MSSPNSYKLFLCGIGSEKEENKNQSKEQEKEEGELDEDDYEDYDEETQVESAHQKNQELEIKALDITESRQKAEFNDNEIEIKAPKFEVTNREPINIHQIDHEADEKLETITIEDETKANFSPSGSKNKIQMDVSDFDDDDDFCLDSKRLKIDESESRETADNEQGIQSELSNTNTIMDKKIDLQNKDKTKNEAFELHQDINKVSTLFIANLLVISSFEQNLL